MSPIVPCHVTCCVHVCYSPVHWLRTWIRGLSKWRVLSLGICSAFSVDREDPLPFLCLNNGLSRRACSHHLSFLTQDILSTTYWGSLSSGFTRTLSGVFQLTSSDGENLLLPTRSQWQLVCVASLTWRLESNNFLVGTLLGVKFQGQCWEWKLCRLGCVTAWSSWGWQLCGWETGYYSETERLYCDKIPQLLEGIILKEKGFLVCHQLPADCPESGIPQQSLWHLLFVIHSSNNPERLKPVQARRGQGKLVLPSFAGIFGACL